MKKFIKSDHSLLALVNLLHLHWLFLVKALESLCQICCQFVEPHTLHVAENGYHHPLWSSDPRMNRLWGYKKNTTGTNCASSMAHIMLMVKTEPIIFLPLSNSPAESIDKIISTPL